MKFFKLACISAVVAGAIFATTAVPASAKPIPRGVIANEYLAVACPVNATGQPFVENSEALIDGVGGLKAALAAANTYNTATQDLNFYLALLVMTGPRDITVPGIGLLDRFVKAQAALQSVLRARGVVSYVRAYTKWEKIMDPRPDYANQIRSALNLPTDGWCPKK
ncbi:unannotated protein [freshwater metagenome]|uniref:Unannotated protein n=1 Tax=freshwater metagenome TaxID=449393 RepID=A0A6J7ILE9_9ZZZZ|nr:hypothetical protein [Actinomycetota bacterium]